MAVALGASSGVATLTLRGEELIDAKLLNAVQRATTVSFGEQRLKGFELATELQPYVDREVDVESALTIVKSQSTNLGLTQQQISQVQEALNAANAYAELELVPNTPTRLEQRALKIAGWNAIIHAAKVNLTDLTQTIECLQQKYSARVDHETKRATDRAAPDACFQHLDDSAMTASMLELQLQRTLEAQQFISEVSRLKLRARKPSRSPQPIASFKRSKRPRRAIEVEHHLDSVGDGLLSMLYYERRMMFGRDRLYDYLKHDYPDFVKYFGYSRRYVAAWLKRQELSQMFQPIRNLKRAQLTAPTQPHKQIALDLADMVASPQAVAENGERVVYRYILTGIDLGSKRAFARAMRGKSKVEALEAMHAILYGSTLTVVFPESDGMKSIAKAVRLYNRRRDREPLKTWWQGNRNQLTTCTAVELGALYQVLLSALSAQKIRPATPGAPAPTSELVQSTRPLALLDALMQALADDDKLTAPLHVPQYAFATVGEPAADEYGVVVELPHSIRTDNGSEFKSDVWAEYFDHSYLGIRAVEQDSSTGLPVYRRIARIFSLPYSPWSNGGVERFNKYIKRHLKMISAITGENNWVGELANVVQMFNVTMSATTGFRPDDLEHLYHTGTFRRKSNAPGLPFTGATVENEDSTATPSGSKGALSLAFKNATQRALGCRGPAELTLLLLGQPASATSKAMVALARRGIESLASFVASEYQTVRRVFTQRQYALARSVATDRYVLKSANPLREVVRTCLFHTDLSHIKPFLTTRTGRRIDSLADLREQDWHDLCARVNKQVGSNSKLYYERIEHSISEAGEPASKRACKSVNAADANKKMTAPDMFHVGDLVRMRVSVQGQKHAPKLNGMNWSKELYVITSITPGSEANSDKCAQANRDGDSYRNRRKACLYKYTAYKLAEVVLDADNAPLPPSRRMRRKPNQSRDQFRRRRDAMLKDKFPDFSESDRTLAKMLIDEQILGDDAYDLSQQVKHYDELQLYVPVKNLELHSVKRGAIFKRPISFIAGHDMVSGSIVRYLIKFKRFGYVLPVDAGPAEAQFPRETERYRKDNDLVGASTLDRPAVALASSKKKVETNGRDPVSAALGNRTPAVSASATAMYFGFGTSAASPLTRPRRADATLLNVMQYASVPGSAYGAFPQRVTLRAAPLRLAAVPNVFVHVLGLADTAERTPILYTPHYARNVKVVRGATQANELPVLVQTGAEATLNPQLGSAAIRIPGSPEERELYMAMLATGAQSAWLLCADVINSAVAAFLVATDRAKIDAVVELFRRATLK